MEAWPRMPKTTKLATPVNIDIAERVKMNILAHQAWRKIPSAVTASKTANANWKASIARVVKGRVCQYPGAPNTRRPSVARVIALYAAQATALASISARTDM